MWETVCACLSFVYNEKSKLFLHIFPNSKTYVHIKDIIVLLTLNKQTLSIMRTGYTYILIKSIHTYIYIYVGKLNTTSKIRYPRREIDIVDLIETHNLCSNKEVGQGYRRSICFAIINLIFFLVSFYSHLFSETEKR